MSKANRIEISSGKPLESLCGDLRAAAARHQFGVMYEHDLKATMAKKGVDFAREVRVFEVCNPQQAKKVLEANPSVSSMLPCRIAIFVGEDGRAWLSTVKPTVMLGFFDAPEVAGVADEVETAMRAIMEEAASS